MAIQLALMIEGQDGLTWDRWRALVSAAALEAGFNAYMMKPIRLETLCRLVKQLATSPP